MENEKMLEIAVQTLSSFDPQTIETVQIERTKYDDGSAGFSVNVTFPAIEKKKKNGIATEVDINKIVSNTTKRLEEQLRKPL